MKPNSKTILSDHVIDFIKSAGLNDHEKEEETDIGEYKP